ncbi:MAG: efflux RND transporter periplasmic adaptor subunit, partial [Candidatus Omnitrophota bacterium]
AEEDARRRAEEDVRRRTEEDARRRAEEDVSRRTEEEEESLRFREEEEESLRRREEEDARRREEEESLRRREEKDARRREEEESLRRRAEEDARLRAEENARRREKEEIRRREEERLQKHKEIIMQKHSAREAKIQEKERVKQAVEARKKAIEEERVKAREEVLARKKAKEDARSQKRMARREKDPSRMGMLLFGAKKRSTPAEPGPVQLQNAGKMSRPRRSAKKKFIWILLGILIAALLLARTADNIKQVFFKDRQEKEKAPTEISETMPVKVYRVKFMDFKDTLPVMGRIEGFKEIDLRFDGKGMLESFNFEEGERILEGDIIASIDQKDALLKLKYAALEMEKNKRLYELGGVDKLMLDQKKLEYESSKRELEKTNIYAPSDGYLGSKERDTGSFVTSQDKIGVFVDFREVYAAFDVIEEDSPKVKLGQNAEVFLDAYPNVTYTGTVDMASPMISGRTRTQKVKIRLENEKDKMRPGMFARAIINTYEKKDVLIIPASAFKKQENKYFVYVVHPDAEEEPEIEDEDLMPQEQEEELPGGEIGVVEVREIGIEYLTHDMAEVGKGLEEGELVIRELHREYKDGDKVEITEIQETIF